MAAHALPPLRASRTPTAVAPAFAILRPIHGAMRHIHPLRRGGPSLPAPLKIQAGTRDNPFRLNCDKHADNLNVPDNHDSDKASPSDDCPLVVEMKKKLQAAGVRETPDMFITENERLSSYMKKLTSSPGIMDVEEMSMARRLCQTAQGALKLASFVMNTASLRRGLIQFSQQTVDQMVRTYAAIFCNVAEDAYHKKFEIETFLSFLGALRGLVAIYHILVQDTVAKLKDGHLKNSITYDMDKYSQYFDESVKYLEDVIVETKPREATANALCDGILFAHVYLFLLARCRVAALGYLKD